MTNRHLSPASPKFVARLVLIPFCLFFYGCAAITAMKHADKKPLEILNHGVARDNVVTYLGAPATSEREGEKITDIYQFKQGFTGGNKASRATMHIAMDALTLFIWELIAWPAEAIMDGQDMTVKVVYDDKKLIEDFTILKRS